MLCFHAAQTGNHLLRPRNVSEQNQKHFLCPQQMLRARANGETFQPRSHGLSSPHPKGSEDGRPWERGWKHL